MVYCNFTSGNSNRAVNFDLFEFGERIHATLGIAPGAIRCELSSAGVYQAEDDSCTIQTPSLMISIKHEKRVSKASKTAAVPTTPTAKKSFDFEYWGMLAFIISAFLATIAAYYYVSVKHSEMKVT